MKKTLFFLLLLCSHRFVFSQTNEKVYILDSITMQPIPYANIICLDNISGTYTNIEGVFTKPKHGVALISCVGYYAKKITFNGDNDTILLAPQIYNLKEVVVLPNIYEKEIIEGYANKKSEFSLSYSSGREVAVLIENKKKQESLIKKVFLKIDVRRIVRKTTHINYTSVFKINFYNVKDKINIGECISSIILKSDSLTSKNFFDVSDLNLSFPKDGLFVGIEWVGKESLENKELYIVTENLLEPFISTTFKENSIVYERKKFMSDKWLLVDATNIMSIANKKNRGFTPLVSLVVSN